MAPRPCELEDFRHSHPHIQVVLDAHRAADDNMKAMAELRAATALMGAKDRFA